MHTGVWRRPAPALAAATPATRRHSRDQDARLKLGDVEHIGERIETLPVRQLDKVRGQVGNEGSGRRLFGGSASRNHAPAMCINMVRALSSFAAAASLAQSTARSRYPLAVDFKAPPRNPRYPQRD
jgi:hypothetical protein